MISRRIFLRLVGAGATVAAFPNVACSSTPAVTAPPGSFFTDQEWRALGALADVVLPPDDAPGGSGLGAPTYIDLLLRAFEVDPPLIHAGGPFSGRKPFVNGDGTASGVFPEDDFKFFLPLSRVADRAWRLRILGSAGVPGGGPNDALLGPVVGLRDVIKNGLDAAMKGSTTPIETLDLVTLTNIFAGLDADFRQTFAELVVEAALAAPEYGGNGQVAGWTLVHFEGDSQPLGYTVYDYATNAYVEREPVSTADPGPDVDPMDADTRAQLALYTNLLNGRVA